MAKNVYRVITDSFTTWSKKNTASLLWLNLMVMVLLLLKSAGYFAPFFLVSVNHIYVLMLLYSIIFLKIRSRELTVLALIFLVISAVLTVFHMDVWAVRSAWYMYQAFLIALIFGLVV